MINPLRIFQRKPRPPTRMTECAICHNPVETETTEGEVVHWGCAIARKAARDALARKEAERRDQIEIVKQALREFKEEEENRAGS
jgi:hypothetical protein